MTVSTVPLAKEAHNNIGAMANAHVHVIPLHCLSPTHLFVTGSIRLSDWMITCA